MAWGKGLLAYTPSVLCVLQNIGIIGYSIYQVCWGTGRQEVLFAIIASVIGCVSNKLSVKQNVVLPSNAV